MYSEESKHYNGTYLKSGRRSISKLFQQMDKNVSQFSMNYKKGDGKRRFVEN